MLGKATLHLWIWIALNSQSILTEEDALIPQRYLQTFEIECLKLEKTSTPSILVYLRESLNDKKKIINEFNSEASKAIFVDHDDVKKSYKVCIL